MRHFEDYEIEHLLNSTGSFLLRFRCRAHLKHCPVCRQRLEKLKLDLTLIADLRNGISRMNAAVTGEGDRETGGDSIHGRT